MARTVSVSPQEVAEREAAKRGETRKSGFELMAVRDKGWAKMTNGVTFLWPVDRENRPEGVPYRNIPEGHFVLSVNGKDVLFDAEEFQRYLRWV